jgi:hypothetical protein
MNSFTIYIIVTIIVLLSFLYIRNDKEAFTNDEAVKNVASLYNSGMATVSNLKATNNVTADISMTTPVLQSGGRLHLSGPELLFLLNKSGVIIGKEWGGNGNLTVQGDLNASGVSTLPNLNAGNMNINGDVLGGKGRMHITGPELLFLLHKNGVIIGKEWGGNGNLSVQGDTALQGNVNINGMTTMRVNVVFPIKWDQGEMTRHITNNNFFNKNMPDGTMMKFLFVHPGDMNVNHPNRWFLYFDAIKMGNQFLMAKIQAHENVPNPANNLSNDLSWRGNIN